MQLYSMECFKDGLRLNFPVHCHWQVWIFFCTQLIVSCVFGSHHQFLQKCFKGTQKKSIVMSILCSLLGKEAFFALVANGVRAAPLWENKKQSFVGKKGHMHVHTHSQTCSHLHFCLSFHVHRHSHTCSHLHFCLSFHVHRHSHTCSHLHFCLSFHVRTHSHTCSHLHFCLFTCAHTHTHALICISVFSRAHTHMLSPAFLSFFSRAHTLTHALTCISVFLFTCTHTYTHALTCISVFLFMCTHTLTHMLSPAFLSFFSLELCFRSGRQRVFNSFNASPFNHLS